VRNVRLLLVAALFFTGCSYFSAASKLEDCEGLLITTKGTLENSNIVIQKAITVIDSLEYKNEILKFELEKCQTN